MNKKQLRERYLSERLALSAQAVSQKSGSLCQRAIEVIQASDAVNVHLFLPIQEKQEVDTWPLFEYLIRSEKHRPIISKTLWTQRQLSHHPMTAADQWAKSKLGIPEPTHDREVTPETIDLVLVPLLTFDNRGHRLGYGAGLYDRFLASCRKDCLKVGLSLLEMHAQELPAEPTDIALNACITPAEFIKF